MLKLDLHTHTKEDLSDKINYTAKEMVDLAIKKKYDAIAITLHNKIFWSKKLYNYSKKKGLLLIPGSEIDIKKKHVLIYPKRAEFNVNKIKTFEDLRRYKKQLYLVIAPHPFFRTKQCLGRYLFRHINLFDGIEYSHFYTKHINLNKKAVKTAKEYNKPLIGTSDCHYKMQLGKTYSLVRAKKNKEDIFKAIKGKKIKVVTKAPTPIEYSKVLLTYFIRKFFKQAE